MVNYQRQDLDRVFAALVDPTRRAILARLEQEESLSISTIAAPFSIKLPAVMKHLDVLGDAGLITRSKQGRSTMARLAQMKTKQISRSRRPRGSTAAIALGVFLLPLSLGAPALAGAQAAYPSRAPIEQYLSPSPAVEIAQARAAAPPSISNDAEILTLGAHGYETAVKGKNGFVCMVERSWDSGLDDDEFWNPKGRAPICFNPAGARSVLPGFLKRTQWVLSGMSRAEIKEHIKAAVAANEIPAPEVGTITYMLAKDAYHSDRVHGPWHPHLMFFLPRMSETDWGANLPGSQVMGSTGSVEPYTIFFVPVAKWSDGTPDAQPMPNM